MHDSKKFLIIGANGLIGNAVSAEIRDKHICIGSAYPQGSANLLNLDITKPEEIGRVFDKVKPDIAVHCANLKGGVDFCEKNPEAAKRFHFDATTYLGNECLKHNSRLIFISSECVFDGKKEYYDEDDATAPLNLYGKWKARSEEWIQRNLSNYIIARTMSVYGWDPLTTTPNAIMNVYFSIEKKENICAPTFRWGMPTYVKDLAKAIVELSLFEKNGIFHVAGASFANRYEWLHKVCDKVGWDSSFLTPTDEDGPKIAERPLSVKLNTQKFNKAFNTRLHRLDEALDLLKEDIEGTKNLSLEDESR